VSDKTPLFASLLGEYRLATRQAKELGIGMGSLTAQAFSFGQLMLAAATGAVMASMLLGLLVWAKHDALKTQVRHAEDDHRQARRLLALHRSAAGYLVDGRLGPAEPGRLAHHSLQSLLRAPTQASWLAVVE
jgi:uncharacterized membrane protein